MGGASAGVEHYPLFVLGAILPWTFLANSVSSAGNSLVANHHLVTKVYFPRLFIPMSQVGVAMFDLLVGLVLLGIALAANGVPPSAGWLLAVPISGVLCLGGPGDGRGVGGDHRLNSETCGTPCRSPCRCGCRHAVDLFARVGVRGNGLGVAAAQPGVRLVGGFRDAALGLPVDLYSVGVSAAVAVVLCYGGLWTFRGPNGDWRT